MAIEVRIPAPFRRLTGNRPRVSGSGATIDRLLADLDAQFPGFRDLLLDGEGRIPPHIKLYVNGQEIGSRDGLETELKDGDEVAIIPATAGGMADDFELMAEQRERYSRHLVLPGWGDHPTITTLIDYDAFCGAVARK